MKPITAARIAGGAKLLLLLAICFLFVIGSVLGGNKHEEIQEEEEKEPLLLSTPPSIIDASKSIFSLPTRLSPAYAAANYLMKLKKLLLHHAFSHPNLDFRRGRDDLTTEEATEGNETPTPGEKVKEAIAKTLDKSKAAIEDSAKTAARFAGEAAEKTAEKVKKSTLSHTTTQYEAEL